MGICCISRIKKLRSFDAITKHNRIVDFQGIVLSIHHRIYRWNTM
ncbi:hypothetical protein HMPREF3190_00052 [Umbribacter vaginalis]|nr:hypothetical protein HMPREF3190_00052 [Coriobacteriales bacterium DNF00809]